MTQSLVGTELLTPKTNEENREFPASISIGEKITDEVLRQIERIESNIRTAEQLSGSVIVR